MTSSIISEAEFLRSQVSRRAGGLIVLKQLSDLKRQALCRRLEAQVLMMLESTDRSILYDLWREV